MVDTALVGWREHLGGLGWSASGYTVELIIEEIGIL
jgi:hypothetical protein